MTKNMSRTDQILRLGVSVALIYVGFVNTQLIDDAFTSTILGIIGVFNLIFALIRSCPLYLVSGINTCHKEGK